MPFSPLLKSSSWEAMSLIRRVWRRMEVRASCFPSQSASGDRAYSHWERMTARGVRSSWETSEVKRRSLAKDS